MKRTLRLAALFALIWLLVPGAALADDGLPRTALNLDPGHLPLYEKFPVWSYTVDTVAMDGALRQLGHLINGVNLTRAWGLKLAIRALEYAVTWRLPTDLSTAANRVVTSLRTLLWDGSLSPLITAAIVLTGASLLWLAALRGRGRAAWESVLRLFITLVIGTMVMGAAGSWLPSALSLTADFNAIIFTETVRTAAPATVGIVSLQVQKWGVTNTGDAAWRAFVVNPWAVAEFGGLEAAGRHAQGGIPGGELLALAQTRRTDWYWSQPQTIRDRDLSWWTEDALPRRLTITLASMAGAGLFAAALFLLSGAVIVQQLIVLMLAMAAPYIFLLALWPGIGPPLLHKWTQWLLRSLVGQTAAMLLLGLVAVLTSLLSGLETSLGWEMVAFLLAGLAVGVFWVRRFITMRWRRPQTFREERQAAMAERTVWAERQQPVRVPARFRTPSMEGDAPSMPTMRLPADQSQDSAASDLAHELVINRTRALLAQQGDPAVHRPAGLPRQVRGAVPPIYDMIRHSESAVATNYAAAEEMGAAEAPPGTGAPAQRDLRSNRPATLMSPGTRPPRR
jgi:hypothetical protein